MDRDRPKKNFGLTSIEMELMKIFWENPEQGFTFKELKGIVQNTLGKNWKYQTLGTHLANLQRVGLLDVDDSNKNYVYCAHGTKEEHIQKWTQNLIRTAFGNSIGNLVYAFTGGGCLPKEEAEKIKKLIQ